jgi:hypothetical protein
MGRARERPEAKLMVRGSLEALLQLTGKVESVGSPGGIWTLVTLQTPPRECRLVGRHYLPSSSVCKQLRAAVTR